jgi:hypothetical protein
MTKLLSHAADLRGIIVLQPFSGAQTVRRIGVYDR